MRIFLSSLWILITNSLLFLLQLTDRLVFRIKKVEDAVEKDLNQHEPFLQAHELEKIEEDKNFDDNVSESSAFSSFSFKFQYQVPEDNIRKDKVEKEESSHTTTNISHYQFLSEKNFSGFIEEPEAMAFRIEESFVHPEFDSFEKFFLSENNLQKQNLGENIELDGEGKENRNFNTNILGVDSDSESSGSDGYSVKNLNSGYDSEDLLSEGELAGDELESQTAETSSCSSRDQFDIYKADKKLVIKQHNKINYYEHNDEQGESVRFNAHDYERTVNTTNSENYDEIAETSVRSSKDTFDTVEVNRNLEEAKVQLLSHMPLQKIDVKIYEQKQGHSVSFTAEGSERGSDLNHLEDSIWQLEANIDSVDETMLGELDELENKHENLENENTKTEEDISMKDLDADEMDELESLWEHQDLIEQLKMELKNVRAIGLPTILEESETDTPRTPEDLKPWKIDDKFLHEDPIDELHKFYKCYLEKMRKLDILNYQKMYAIGFLQMKNPLESLGSQKTPKITTLLSQNFWLYRRRKCSDGPSEKFMKELQCDLEIVYVGQTCLSWEFLRWQYEKAQNLPATDPYRTHQYSHAAGEFQQFQVLMQRFVENESFQGPRVPNYVKSRCVLRNLLQVPVIKEDSWKDKLDERKRGNDTITSEFLEDLMEECTRVFWEFIKADKDETPVILKGLISTNIELQDPSDYKLMIEAQQILLKKEKKLKDILRTGNCIVRKFKKPREDRSNQDILFSQIDLKLVARVLRMSRITSDQLLWCHKKLNKIKFVDRKIYRESSFLLFPC